MTSTHPLDKDPALRLLDSIDKHMTDILKVLKNQNDMITEIHTSATSPEDRLLISEWNANTKRLTDAVEAMHTSLKDHIGSLVIHVKVRVLQTWNWCARTVRGIHRPHLRPIRKPKTPAAEPVAA